jgi:hypothetical protein
MLAKSLHLPLIDRGRQLKNLKFWVHPGFFQRCALYYFYKAKTPKDPPECEKSKVNHPTTKLQQIR